MSSPFPSKNDLANPSRKIIHLDGRTLEGGGQLVRNAVALSALTGKPITITDIRGNRHGKTGLKGSHAAAIKFLAEICQGEVIGGEIGSHELTFYPRGYPREETEEQEKEEEEEEERKGPLLNLTLTNGELPNIRSEYTVHQSTAGSIFLIFQAVYPYLVHAGSLAGNSKKPVQLNITGGTNVSCAPSFEYIDQVLVPNLRRIGLPELSVRLHKRGWSTGGPKTADLGEVSFFIHPLGSEFSSSAEERNGRSIISGFPALNLSQCRRAPITKIDITVLAPDTDLRESQAQGNRKDRRKAGRESESRSQYSDDDAFPRMTIREYIEEQTQRRLHRALQQLPKDAIARQSVSTGVERKGEDDDDEIIPIELLTSEATHHHTHLYILLVAHTSNGFTLGADALFDGFKRSGRKHHSSKHRGDQGGNSMISTLNNLADSCVSRLMEELLGRIDGSAGSTTKHQPCVDVHMRDQLVIFDALGSLEKQRANQSEDVVSEEDERYWSLHTRTARWVCERILGEGLWS